MGKLERDGFCAHPQSRTACWGSCLPFCCSGSSGTFQFPFCCWDKCPDKKQLRCFSGLQFQVKVHRSNVVRVERVCDSGHIVSTVKSKEKTGTSLAQLAFLTLILARSHLGNGIAHSGLDQLITKTATYVDTPTDQPDSENSSTEIPFPGDCRLWQIDN